MNDDFFGQYFGHFVLVLIMTNCDGICHPSIKNMGRLELGCSQPELRALSTTLSDTPYSHGRFLASNIVPKRPINQYFKTQVYRTTI